MRQDMAPNSTPVTRFLWTGKRCLRVFRSLRMKKNKSGAEEEKPTGFLGRRETFHLSTTSLDKRRYSEDSRSVDTIITLLDDHCALDNFYNEKIENDLIDNYDYIEGLLF